MHPCRRLLLAVLLPLLAHGADDPLQLIFHAPFDDAPHAVVARGNPIAWQYKVDQYQPGRVGQAARSEKRYNGVRFDGRGNIDLDRGSFAFHYQLLTPPDAMEWDSLAGVSTEVEGYWYSVMQFMGKVDLAKQYTFGVQFFDIGRYSPLLQYRPIYQRWKAEEWHHLAIVWDRHHGMTIYEDGQRADSNWGEFPWQWNAVPRVLVFGQWVYSTRPFVVDDARVYATCLTDAQIAQLARGEAPTGPPLTLPPDEQFRAADLDRMGWAPADLPHLPALAPAAPLRVTVLRVDHASDAQRRIAQPFDGLPDTCWPLQKYGASAKGQRLQLYLAPGQQWTHCQLFAQRPFRGRLFELPPGEDATPLATVNAERPFWRYHQDTPRSDRLLLLDREVGQLGHIDLLRSEAAAPPATVHTTFQTAPLDRLPPTLAGCSALGDTPTRYDRPVQAATATVPAWTAATPAFGGFQLITPVFAEPVALEGVVLTLVAEGVREPTPLRVVVKEPVFPQRNWLSADVLLQPAGPGPQRYTLHLAGRPVIPLPPATYQLGKSEVRDPGRELAVLVTAAAPLTWHFGTGGTTIGLCATELAAALPIATADQTEFAREAYAETNEGHIWDNLPPPGWELLYAPALWLQRFAPESRAAMELASRVRWRQEPLPYAAPTPPPGVPEWAFWQRQAMHDVQSIVHWIIDHRQTPNGEFGGVWGDDTDMSEYWTDYALACDDSGKIGDALRRFWRGVYTECTVDGVSRTIRDALHSYEEGMGAFPQQMLLDYGHPLAIERTMRAASHCDGKWMKLNEDGTYSFRSNYFGYGGVYEEGAFGQDTGVTHLMLIPAAYLTWYNRQPTVTPFIAKWRRSPGPGLVGDAWYYLTFPNAAERVAEYLKRNGEPKVGTSPLTTNAYLDEVGIPDAWKTALLNQAKANPWKVFEGQMPDYAGYSPTMTEYFWLAYRLTGDTAYLAQSDRQACQFINNQRWLYTEAQPSTDRIPLPSTSVTRARLGALAAYRGGSSSFWPRHGLSYPQGGEELAALVTRNEETALAARFYCFTDQPHPARLRVWRLLPGDYELVLSRDADHDGQANGELERRSLAIDRGSDLDLTFPPHASVVLTLTAKTTRPVDYSLPDPAICGEDVVLEYGDHLHLTVHNLGARPVDNLRVRLRDGHTGKVVGETTLKHLDAPLDLQPRTALLEVSNLNAVTRGTIIIELDPEQQHPDFNRHNNRVVFGY
jgi:hypothetical protein